MQYKHEADFYYGLHFLDKLPEERLFQLFVEGEVHVKEQGAAGFEAREPGCMQSFYNGLEIAVAHLHEPLSVELLLKIHQAASVRVGGQFYGEEQGMFRSCKLEPLYFDQEFCTRKGLIEYINEINQHDLYMSPLNNALEVWVDSRGKYYNLLEQTWFIKTLVPEIYQNSNKNNLIYYPPTLVGYQLAEKAKQIVQVYLDKMAALQAQDMDAHLFEIVGCAKKMLLLHPFRDGNLRVSVCIMLNFLLMQRGYPPCVFYNPNIFYLYATEELVDIIKIGMNDCLFLIEQPDKPLFGYAVKSKGNKETIELKSKITSILEQKICSKVDMYSKTNALKMCIQSSFSTTIGLFNTLTHGAESALDVELARHLVMLGPENTTTFYKGRTAYHLACFVNAPHIVDFLLKNVPDVLDIQDFQGKTALHIAIEHNNIQCVEYLVTAGASLTVEDNIGRNAFALAEENGDADIINYLKNKISLPYGY